MGKTFKINKKRKKSRFVDVIFVCNNTTKMVYFTKNKSPTAIYQIYDLTIKTFKVEIQKCHSATYSFS